MQPDAMPSTFQDKRYNCFVTDSADLIHKAQCLRHRVFVGELDANFEHTRTPLYGDEFDAYSEHLIVFDYYELKVIGYARLLDAERAAKAGCFYSQNKFDMDALFKPEGRLLEVGHICVDPAYRSNAVLAELCNGLSRYALEGGYQYLSGCAGIVPETDGFCVETLRQRIAANYLAAPDLKADPLMPIPE